MVQIPARTVVICMSCCLYSLKLKGKNVISLMDIDQPCHYARCYGVSQEQQIFSIEEDTSKRASEKQTVLAGGKVEEL